MSAPYDYDYIVIGSGFGGSVSALRLTEKGYNVAVLEQGKRFRCEDFPKTNWNLPKYLWMPKLRMFGFQAISLLKDVLVFHGAGVGGGSLVYANTLPTPPSSAFRDPRWPTHDDWETRLAPFYETARRMLGAVEAKNVYPTDDMIREIVDGEMGAKDSFHRHQVSVYFGEPGEAVPDPYFQGEGPERTGCIECGRCMSGCPHNAKNTLDKNYLYLAEKRGAVVHPETKAVDVRPLAGSGYEVRTIRSTALFGRQRRALRAQGVVFSASVLGTVPLLLDCKARGSLATLSDHLGNYVRTNSEAILYATAHDDEVDYSKGIAITSGVHPDEHTHIEMCRYGEGQDFMSLMGTVLTGGGEGLPRSLRWLGNILRHPLLFLRTVVPFGWARRSGIVLFMQPLSSYMRLAQTRGLFGKRVDSALVEGQKVPTYIPKANEIARRMAERMGGDARSMLLEVVGNRSSTAHILGGATMGRTPGDGVCDELGRVFGYENMYVCDGSLVPANLGVNPSLTITALSEYVMHHVPPKEGADRRPAPRPQSG
jgi:cholesterol oxidase